MLQYEHFCDENVEPGISVNREKCSHPRTPLRSIDGNAQQIIAPGVDAMSKTPVNDVMKSSFSVKKAALLANSGSRQIKQQKRHIHSQRPPGTPVRPLNESLFEVVEESPRDIKIKELTKMVKAFRQDAKYIRDIYSEEIESLRQELEIYRNQETSEIEKFKCDDSTVVDPNDVSVQDIHLQTNEETEDFDFDATYGASHANSIISEAESIIAMAEAMLQSNKTKHGNAIPSAIVTVSKVKPSEKETEILKLKEEIFHLREQRYNDQKKISEMELVMQAMAQKLEEYAKSNSTTAPVLPNFSNMAEEESWTNKVLSIFS